MGNPFLIFFKYWPKLFQNFFYNINMDILISNLLSESILDFRKWSTGKYANSQICVFPVWPLPEVQNWFQKQIWKKNVHISILIFFEECRLLLNNTKENSFMSTYSDKLQKTVYCQNFLTIKRKPVLVEKSSDNNTENNLSNNILKITQTTFFFFFKCSDNYTENDFH